MKKILLLFFFLQPLSSYCMTPATLALFIGASFLGAGSCIIICHESDCCPDKPNCCKKYTQEEEKTLIDKQPTKKEPE